MKGMQRAVSWVARSASGARRSACRGIAGLAVLISGLAIGKPPKRRIATRSRPFSLFHPCLFQMPNSRPRTRTSQACVPCGQRKIKVGGASELTEACILHSRSAAACSTRLLSYEDQASRLTTRVSAYSVMEALHPATYVGRRRDIVTMAFQGETRRGCCHGRRLGYLLIHPG